MVLKACLNACKRANKVKYDNFYSSSKAEISINKSDIDDVFE